MAHLTAAEFRDRVCGTVIPAVPVPMEKDGQYHSSAQERYSEYVRGQDVSAVAVWAHTGRGLHLPAEQRRAVLRNWKNSGLLVVAGVGARGDAQDPHRAALEMAQEAMSWGADALLIHPPTALRGRDRQDALTFSFHEHLAGVGLPVILFELYAEAGGIRYSDSLLNDLLALPQVVGIKMATLKDAVRFQDVSRIVSGFPDKLLITGEDRFLGASILWGATCALIGLGAARVDLSAGLLRSHVAGDTQKFLGLSDAVDRFAQVTFIPPMEGYIRRMLWALVVAGIIPEDASFDPYGPAVPDAQLDAVRDFLDTSKLVSPLLHE